jgi:hypothetical protein
LAQLPAILHKLHAEEKAKSEEQWASYYSGCRSWGGLWCLGLLYES